MPDVDSSDPNWSPDGSRIVLAIGRTDRGRRYIGIMQVATKVITEIPDSNGLGSPRWSPDGRYIAALSPVPPCLRIFDMTGRKWRSISIEGDINFPSWSHDGRYIYGLAFDTVRGNRSVFRAPMARGKPELIMDLNEWKLTG